MPILPAEPDMFPTDLWARTLEERNRLRWWCLHTRPRQEKATARELHARGIAYYLPQIAHEDRTPKGRRTRSILPLFTSYVFLWGDQSHRVQALRGNRLVNVIEVSDQPGLDRDLRQIHQMLCSGLAVAPEPYMPVGTQIKIVSGPLAGIEGTVVRRGQRDEFVAVVQFLGRGATVELQDWQVEPVRGQAQSPWREYRSV